MFFDILSHSIAIPKNPGLHKLLQLQEKKTDLQFSSCDTFRDGTGIVKLQKAVSGSKFAGKKFAQQTYHLWNQNLSSLVCVVLVHDQFCGKHL